MTTSVPSYEVPAYTHHDGSSLATDARFAVEPDARLGRVRSAATSEREGRREVDARERLGAAGRAMLAALAGWFSLAIVAMVTMRVLGPPEPIVGITVLCGAGLLGAALGNAIVRTRKRGGADWRELSYVGSKGAQHVVVRPGQTDDRVFVFDSYERLDVESSDARFRGYITRTVTLRWTETSGATKELTLSYTPGAGGLSVDRDRAAFVEATRAAWDARRGR